MEEVMSNGTPGIDLSDLSASLLASSTTRRKSDLQTLQHWIQNSDIPEADAGATLQLLFKTYPLYHDRGSRRAVQGCLQSLLANSTYNACLPILAKAIKAETSKLGLAPSNAFVLVEWCSLVIQHCGTHPEAWKSCGLDLIASDAQILELCVSFNARDSVRQSALVVTRRALRKVFGNPEIGEDAIKATVVQLTSKAQPLGSRSAVLLGVVAGVCARMQTREPTLDGLKEHYLSFYVREIIGSRTAVSLHIRTALHDFISGFVTLQDLQRDIVPAFEKALLRSPEVVLDDLLSSMIRSLSPEVDLSELASDHLLKPLLANTKSTNAAIRGGALATFSVLIGKCRNKESLEKITDEVSVPLTTSRLSAADQRVLYARMLCMLKPVSSRSTTLCKNLSSIIAKEPNEAALGAEASALAHHLAFVIKSGSKVDSSAFDVFAKGISDKRVPVRKMWSLNTGELLWKFNEESVRTEPMIQFTEAVVPKLLEAFNEVAANPLPASQTGLVVAAYVVTALSEYLPALIESEKLVNILRKANVQGQALAFDSKPSFLLNYKVYTKLVVEEDLTWAVRAVAACSSSLTASVVSLAASDAWMQTILYLITASTISPDVRRDATAALTKAYVSQPAAMAELVVKGLWHWHRHVELSDKDTAAVAAKTGTSKLHLAVRAICLPPDDVHFASGRISSEVLQTQLMNMLVLCRPELLARVSWIEVCLRVGQDPGALARENGTRCLDQIIRSLDPDKDGTLSETVALAAYNTAAELAFVAPDVITPLIIEEIKSDLKIEEVRQCGPTEVAIARTPEGTAFIDILSRKGQSTLLDKNSRDYDTLKWEEELRSQLAQRKGQQKKLSADDQAKVNAQLKKEAIIRQNVLGLERRLRRGIGLIHGLATGPPTEADLWMGPSLRTLLDVIGAGAGLLVGDVADAAYISCAHLISSRLGPARRFIGVATLRSLGTSHLASDLEQEPLGGTVDTSSSELTHTYVFADLVTRILYRLRLTSEQRPFDPVSLIYILPFVFLVLQMHGVGQPVGDEADEQVTLALEFLSYHADTCEEARPQTLRIGHLIYKLRIGSHPRLPRAETISTLISSMQAFPQHYKVIKNCLLDLCRSVAANITEIETSILLRGTIVPQASVRTSVLEAIRSEIDLTDLDFSDEIWLACHDDLDENVELGRAVWGENALEVESADAKKMLPYLESSDKQLRRAASRSLTECIDENRATFRDILNYLEDKYREKAKPIVPERDEYGMLKKTNLADPWEARSGMALAFKELASIFDPSKLVSFIEFLINDSALGDRNATVRDEMIQSATAVIAIHGGDKVEELMKMFEEALEQSIQESDVKDLVNEAIIILYGALARHLHAGDERVPKVVQRLLLTLSTPSETVQYAVAACLPPLIRTSSQNVPEYIQQTLDQLFQSKRYAARRGAAYGLAGIVQGKGVSALREYRIMSTLRGAIDNKKDQNQREGALFAYELLSLILGRTFEPYVIQIVPQLLSSFGDASADVRAACLDAAKTCFASLSSYGVRQILPTLLEGLQEQQWRSKKGACDLLGAMAYLDPQQLALSLPEIIPPLTNVLNDSHKEVRLAANRSLQRFGEVISNPEVKGLVGILLKALSDPTKYTDEALDSLIKVSFIHYLDSPSLALVVRILERGLGDRSATKRKSAQIIGSLAHLTERKDLVSHLPILVAGLKSAVVDPVPTTRATASKALGSLVEKLGEDALPDLIPGLMSTLKSETGAGDRLGSAQALSEVLAGLGTGRLEEILPTILQNVASVKATVREGFMSLFIFLPACFGNSFATYLSKIIPPILSGLADEVESIRETSLRAGRLLVKNFATKAIDLLLPELDRGLADDSYRIRLSSVELVGDLLFNLTGISGKTEQEEEDEGAAEAGQSLLDVLGLEKRNKILSSLYICRCDTSGLVRSAAINVWKALVATPRTLKELVPTLTQLIIRRLASPNVEQRTIAGTALGELIRKSGEGVLASLLPTLEEGLLTSTDTDNKQGICIALREIISSASLEAIEDYEKTLISVVRTALIDPNDEVREAAAEAFDSLQKIFGKKAVDQVLPYLLNLLRTDGEAENALSALLTLLTDNTRSNIILPNLVPTLLVSPISHFNAKAIASLSEVAGPAMTRRLPTILNALMDNIVACKGDELRNDLESSFDAILLSIDEFDGLNTAMSVMLALVKHDDHRKRAAADMHLSRFFANADIDISRYNPDLIRALLISFDDRDPEVVKAAWTALTELTKRLRKEEMESLVFSTRQVLQQVGVAGSNLPGFALPKGINAILPIFLQGLMNGTAEQRTQSALAISDIIDRTSPDALKPFVTQITGPLIRVVSERSVDVKSAILLTLNNLLEKIPTFLKPFLPQLQRTFAKSLADTSSEVLRTRAAKALGTLITLTPRIDPLIAELVTGSKTQDQGVKNAMLKALYEVVSKAGANMSEASRASILGLIDSDTSDADASMAITHARLLGALIKNLPAAGAAGLIKHRVLTSHFSNASVLSLNSVLLESPVSLSDSFAEDTRFIICQGMHSKNTFVSDNCVLAAGKYLLADGADHSFEHCKPIFEALAALVQPGRPVDTRRLALVVIRTVSRIHNDVVRPHLPLLAPPIFASVRDPVIPVKLAAEAAFLAIFSVVETESVVFERYMAGAGAELNPTTKRSMQDYFKRVAVRLGGQARERKEAEGGQGGLGLSNDEREDEREIWSVGKVDLGEGTFGE